MPLKKLAFVRHQNLGTAPAVWGERRGKMVPTITINMDKKCAECGKGGAAESGICLSCTSKAITGRTMRSEVGRAVQRRNREFLNETRERLNKLRDQ